MRSRAPRRRGAWALLASAARAQRASGFEASAPAATGNVSRLKMVNGCKDEPIWIAHMAIWPENGGVGPDPQNLKLNPGEEYNFNTPPGLSGTRYWPKMGCDSSGNNCRFGDSGGPDEKCNDNGCAPPVDTKFEASFAKSAEEQDWVDVSLVDGYTLPFRFELDGKCGAGFDGSDSGEQDEVETNQYYSIDASWTEHCHVKTGRRYFRAPDGTTTFNPPRIIDCSRLDFKHCPEGEDISAGGADERKDVSLKVKHPDTGSTVGCYSPCSHLSLSHWSEEGAKFYGPPDPEAAPYCCPTPPESPESCREGPVANTKFVKGIHQMCPGVYGYSYDDGMGLLQCPADTKYKVTFYCPAEAAPATMPDDPLLPKLKPLTTTTCSTTTTAPVTTQGAPKFKGFVPEYVPQTASPAPTQGAFVKEDVPVKTTPQTEKTPAMQPQGEEIAFASETSTTTLQSTEPIVISDGTPALDPAPTTMPPPTAPPTAAPPSTTKAAPPKRRRRRRRGPPQPQAAPAAAPATVATVPAPFPAPLATPAPALAPRENPWVRGVRNILTFVGLSDPQQPRGLTDTEAASVQHDRTQRLWALAGFVAALATFGGLLAAVMSRTPVAASSRPMRLHSLNEYGQMQQGPPLASSFAPFATASAPTGSFGQTFYSYR